MEDFASEGKAVGLIFDLSLRHDHDGDRLVDKTKRSLIELVSRCFEDGCDAMYLYHRDIVEAAHHIGQHNAAIGNYDTDGWRFNVTDALKQTLYVVGAEDDSLRRYVILVTDRLSNPMPLEKFLFLNRKDHLGIHLIIFGVGAYYHRASCDLAVVLGDGSVTYYHLDSPSELTAKLLKESYGNQDVCCTPHECSQ